MFFSYEIILYCLFCEPYTSGLQLFNFLDNLVLWGHSLRRFWTAFLVGWITEFDHVGLCPYSSCFIFNVNQFFCVFHDGWPERSFIYFKLYRFWAMWTSRYNSQMFHGTIRAKVLYEWKWLISTWNWQITEIELFEFSYYLQKSYKLWNIKFRLFSSRTKLVF